VDGEIETGMKHLLPLLPCLFYALREAHHNLPLKIVSCATNRGAGGGAWNKDDTGDADLKRIFCFDSRVSLPQVNLI
jgi:hypothetical protein